MMGIIDFALEWVCRVFVLSYVVVYSIILLFILLYALMKLLIDFEDMR